MTDKIIEKLTSGRYYLTVICGIAFLYAVWKRVLPPEATASIITAVFMSYFQRQDREVLK